MRIVEAVIKTENWPEPDREILYLSYGGISRSGTTVITRNLYNQYKEAIEVARKIMRNSNNRFKSGTTIRFNVLNEAYYLNEKLETDLTFLNKLEREALYFLLDEAVSKALAEHNKVQKEYFLRKLR